MLGEVKNYVQEVTVSTRTATVSTLASVPTCSSLGQINSLENLDMFYLRDLSSCCESVFNTSLPLLLGGQCTVHYISALDFVHYLVDI